MGIQSGQHIIIISISMHPLEHQQPRITTGRHSGASDSLSGRNRGDRDGHQNDTIRFVRRPLPLQVRSPSSLFLTPTSS